MKQFGFFVIGAVLAVAAGNACAQYVKGNEAVRLMPDGTTRVETPPTTGALLAKPCPASQAGCAGGGWMMVETPPLPSVPLGKPCPASQSGCAGGGWKMLENDSGLVECTEVFARPGTCRASTYGNEKRSRSWIVKTQGKWMQCQLPELSSRCVSLTSLPVSAVQ